MQYSLHSSTGVFAATAPHPEKVELDKEGGLVAGVELAEGSVWEGSHTLCMADVFLPPHLDSELAVSQDLIQLFLRACAHH